MKTSENQCNIYHDEIEKNYSLLNKLEESYVPSKDKGLNNAHLSRIVDIGEEIKFFEEQYIALNCQQYFSNQKTH